MSKSAELVFELVVKNDGRSPGHAFDIALKERKSSVAISIHTVEITEDNVVSVPLSTAIVNRAKSFDELWMVALWASALVAVCIFPCKDRHIEGRTAP